MKLNPTITKIDPNTFEYQTYSNSDENLIVQSELDTVFSGSTDYIEYYICLVTIGSALMPKA